MLTRAKLSQTNEQLIHLHGEKSGLETELLSTKTQLVQTNEQLIHLHGEKAGLETELMSTMTQLAQTNEQLTLQQELNRFGENFNQALGCEYDPLI